MTTSRALVLASSLLLAAPLTAASEEASPKEKAAEKAQKDTPPKAKKSKPSPTEKMAETKSKLELENALAAEKSKKELANLRSKVARLKLEKELLTEELALAELKQKKALAQETAKFQAETAALNLETQKAKMEAEKMTSQLKTQQAKFGLELSKKEKIVKTIEADNQLASYAKAKPVYLKDPLQEDGTLVISDRRIALNGPIGSDTADHVTERINYFNNKTTEYPIFIVIDSSPGGSVMSGLNILKAMHGSEAPVYVVVKRFAASMAAGITTLAERSFAFPDTVLLHHQVLAGSYGNLSETREHTRQMEEWWSRLATPVAEKMGITKEKFIERMYQQTVTGDWTEFADQAVKLKWVDHVVTNMKETSLLKNPDSKSAPSAPSATTEEKADHLLERLNPKDMLYLYNPDGYYQFAK
ncbi:ATP-dependent Clp protease proteolytic subunit [Roseibacillus ishigakijimensis]|uniref:ATP-dependent Clp protease proteolytic subunit n=1 Tax=Roseibacillus ishigakijimensis TaxID=454146 RepID=A0A934RL65_9BACT|nr:ATP-dependent Clp protease proteolytic subunit [Roseibacillus ishigakijimensis]MBK1832780.1 ATP-dependent Clp protease proteolytic subunit [Roseibacillus ishigakijimensis]